MTESEIIELAKKCGVRYYSYITSNQILTFATEIRNRTLESASSNLSELFRQLRFSDAHIGLGDIRLTIAQQEEIAKALKGDEK